MTTYMEDEIKKVMEQTGMQRMQAYRHVQARRELEQMRRRAMIYPKCFLADLTGKVIKETI